MKISDLFYDTVIEESLSVRYRAFLDSIKGTSLFRYTSLYNASSIVQGNVMHGRFLKDAPYEPKSAMIPYRAFSSFSTRRDNDYSRTGAIYSLGGVSVLFELDKKKLIEDYENMNVDYWGALADERGRTSVDKYLLKQKSEHEIRIFSGRKGITNFGKYIKHVNFLIHKKEITKKDKKTIDQISAKVPSVSFYGTYKDLVSGRNKININDISHQKGK